MPENFKPSKTNKLLKSFYFLTPSYETILAWDTSLEIKLVLDKRCQTSLLAYYHYVGITVQKPASCIPGISSNKR